MPTPEEQAEKIESAHALMVALKGVQGITSVDVTDVVSFKKKSWAFAVTLNDVPVMIKQYRGDDAAIKVAAQAAELAHLSGHMADGRNQITPIVLALPELGMNVLTKVPGDRFDDLMVATDDKGRAALMSHAGAWLGDYVKGRRETSTFAPGFWQRQLSSRNIKAFTSDEVVIWQTLMAQLRSIGKKIGNCPVERAHVHGDWVPANAFYADGVLFGIDVQGGGINPLARDAARFLVANQVFGQSAEVPDYLGVLATDLWAFTASGVLPNHELTTTLPFLIGEQIAFRMLGVVRQSVARKRVMAAAASYLATVDRIVTAP